MEENKAVTTIPMDETISRFFAVGAHFAHPRQFRHPSVAPYIFGKKNRIEIFDLEKTKLLFERTLASVKEMGAAGKIILFASGKSEARGIVEKAATRLGMPLIAGRWIGGTLTNFSAIRSRVDRLENLRTEREKGEHAKYTKRERLMIDREIERLSRLFAGLIPLKKKPDAMFVVDAVREKIAVTEAKAVGVPVIAFSSSDCNMKLIDYPMLGNDAAVASIQFVLDAVVEAYEAGRASRPATALPPAKEAN